MVVAGVAMRLRRLWGLPGESSEDSLEVVVAGADVGLPVHHQPLVCESINSALSVIATGPELSQVADPIIQGCAGAYCRELAHTN